ncbi:histidine kinase [Clostridium malenominatum]|uniref:histidine kinase n=1 Tax=Clostridium malenominatum TaxID=1539 RepID=A0ABP3UFP1_9CLOT
MDKWIILNKFILLVYSFLKYEDLYNKEEGLIVLLLLLYISITMCLYIVKNKNLKIVLGNIIGIYLIIMGVYVTPLFFLYLPINFFELSYKIGIKNIFIDLSILFIALLLQGDFRVDYLFITMSSYLFFTLLVKTKERVDELLIENDKLKASYDKLYNKFKAEEEYESQIIYTSKLEERNKIAQEIHDKIGHTLSGSILQLEAAKLLKEKEEKKSMELIDNTISILRDGMESIRATLRNIKPPSEQVGINKIKLLLEEFSSKSNIENIFICNGELESINYAQWKIIEENLKECLTNTIKYSKGNKITVNLQVLNKLIRVEIKDNGVGEFEVKKGMGLKGIEERCENIGGRVVIDGTKGFLVVFTLPIKL